MSKGSKRRPSRVTPAKFARNWARIFKPMTLSKEDAEVLRQSLESGSARVRIPTGRLPKHEG